MNRREESLKRRPNTRGSSSSRHFAVLEFNRSGSTEFAYYKLFNSQEFTRASAQKNTPAEDSVNSPSEMREAERQDRTYSG